LPLAIQRIARFGDEATLFRLAAHILSWQPWAALDRTQTRTRYLSGLKDARVCRLPRHI